MSSTTGRNALRPSWDEEASRCTAPQPIRAWLTPTLQADMEHYNNFHSQCTWTLFESDTGIGTVEGREDQHVCETTSEPGVPETYCTDGKMACPLYRQGKVQKHFQQLSFDMDTDLDSEGSDIPWLSCEDLQPGLEYAASVSSLSSSVTRDEEMSEIYSEASMMAYDYTYKLPCHAVATSKGLRKANIKILRDCIPTATSIDTTSSASVQWGLRDYRRDRRRRSLKTKVQHLRDRAARSGSGSTSVDVAENAGYFSTIQSQEVGPKRKHCAFVQEQELECLFKDRVGTPHVSELQPGDDVNAQLNVDELSVGGSVAAFSNGGHGASEPSIFEATDIPSEGLGIS